MAKVDPKPIPPLSQKRIDCFWNKIDKTPGQGPWGDCWIWTSRQVSCGYGQFSIYPHGSFVASRIAYFLTAGVDPGSLQVLHRCDNPPCCNLAHLFLGTVADNNADMMRKGRNRQVSGDQHPSRRRPDYLARGAKNHRTRLTELQVHEIRRLLAMNVPKLTIARRFNIERSAIRNIANGTTWKHLEDPPPEVNNQPNQ